MDVDKFLDDLNRPGRVHSEGEFTIDVARARHSLDGHLGLQPQDYACHFVQLAAFLGARRIELRIRGDWLEWVCNGTPFELTLDRGAGLVDFWLNLCIQCLALTHYREKRLASGTAELVHGSGSGWKRVPRRLARETVLSVRLPWRSWAKNFLTGDAWWTQLPEFQALWPRLSGTPLHVTLPRALAAPPSQAMLWVMGAPPAAHRPPRQCSATITVNVPVSFSLGLDFEGHSCTLISQGLAYEWEPILPGTMWLYLGDLNTDLGGQKIIKNEVLEQRLSVFFQELASLLTRWKEREDLLQLGLRNWVQRALLPLEGAPQGCWQQALYAFPCLPSCYHGWISLQTLDEAANAQNGCCYYERQNSLPEAPQEPPIILVAGDEWLDFARRRYREVRPAQQRMERIEQQEKRRQQWKRAGPLDFNSLLSWPFRCTVQFGKWQGMVAFDGEALDSRLVLSRQGRFVNAFFPAPGLIEGFRLLLDHPHAALQEGWQQPELHAPEWQELIDWTRAHQIELLLRAPQTQQQLRSTLARALQDPKVDASACLFTPLFDHFCLAQLLEDCRVGDLRDWVEAGINWEDEFTPFVRRSLGSNPYTLANQAAHKYEQSLQQWSRLPPEELQLPPGCAAWRSFANMPAMLGIGTSPRTVFHLYRQQRKLTSHSPAGFPQGLVVVAENAQFRLNASGSGLDTKSSAYQGLLEETRREIPHLVDQLLRDPPQQQIGRHLLSQLPSEQWPSGAPLFQRLDQTVVSVAQAVTALEGCPNPSVLVDPAVRAVLAGFDQTWLLTGTEFDWLQQIFGPTCCQVVNEDFYEAYKQTRFEPGPSQPMELASQDYVAHSSFQLEGMWGEAALYREEGPIDRCETTFFRCGRAILKCPLRLGAGGLPCPYSLKCVVEWPELPFAESYTELSSLPEITALVDFLRDFAFQPDLQCLDYTLHRVVAEAPAVAFQQAEILPTLEGQRWSIAHMLEKTPILYAHSPCLAEGLLLETQQLQLLQQAFPLRRWRDVQGPSANQRIKEKLRATPVQTLSLPEKDYISRRESAAWVWGLLPEFGEKSYLQVHYHGRPAGGLWVDWEFQVNATIDTNRLHFDEDEQLIVDEAVLGLLQAEIRQAILHNVSPVYRLHFAMWRHGQPGADHWAHALLDQPLLKSPSGQFLSLRQWSEHPQPWPYLDFDTVVSDNAVRLPTLLPVTVGWANRCGLPLRNCRAELVALQKALNAGQQVVRPDAQWELQLPGAYLSSSQWMLETKVVKVYQNILVEQSSEREFPPYYMELTMTDQLTWSPVPPQAFEQLWQWWHRQLAGDCLWLRAWAPHLAACGGQETLRQLAWQRVEQERIQLAQQWPLLQQALDLYFHSPVLLLSEPLGQLAEILTAGGRITVTFNPTHPSIAGKPDRIQVSTLLTWLFLQLPRQGQIAPILLKLQSLGRALQ